MSHNNPLSMRNMSFSESTNTDHNDTMSVSGVSVNSFNEYKKNNNILVDPHLQSTNGYISRLPLILHPLDNFMKRGVLYKKQASFPFSYVQKHFRVSSRERVLCYYSKSEDLLPSYYIPLYDINCVRIKDEKSLCIYSYPSEIIESNMKKSKGSKERDPKNDHFVIKTEGKAKKLDEQTQDDLAGLDALKLRAPGLVERDEWERAIFGAVQVVKSDVSGVLDGVYVRDSKMDDMKKKDAYSHNYDDVYSSEFSKNYSMNESKTSSAPRIILHDTPLIKAHDREDVHSLSTLRSALVSSIQSLFKENVDPNEFSFVPPRSLFPLAPPPSLPDPVSLNPDDIAETTNGLPSTNSVVPESRFPPAFDLSCDMESDEMLDQLTPLPLPPFNNDFFLDINASHSNSSIGSEPSTTAPFPPSITQSPGILSSSTPFSRFSNEMPMLDRTRAQTLRLDVDSTDPVVSSNKNTPVLRHRHSPLRTSLALNTEYEHNSSSEDASPSSDLPSKRTALSFSHSNLSANPSSPRSSSFSGVSPSPSPTQGDQKPSPIAGVPAFYKADSLLAPPGVESNISAPVIQRVPTPTVLTIDKKKEFSSSSRARIIDSPSVPLPPSPISRRPSELASSRRPSELASSRRPSDAALLSRRPSDVLPSFSPHSPTDRSSFYKSNSSVPIGSLTLHRRPSDLPLPIEPSSSPLLNRRPSTITTSVPAPHGAAPTISSLKKANSVGYETQTNTNPILNAGPPSFDRLGSTGLGLGLNVNQTTSFASSYNSSSPLINTSYVNNNYSQSNNSYSPMIGSPPSPSPPSHAPAPRPVKTLKASSHSMTLSQNTSSPTIKPTAAPNSIASFGRELTPLDFMDDLRTKDKYDSLRQARFDLVENERDDPSLSDGLTRIFNNMITNEADQLLRQTHLNLDIITEDDDEGRNTLNAFQFMLDQAKMKSGKLGALNSLDAKNRKGIEVKVMTYLQYNTLLKQIINYILVCSDVQLMTFICSIIEHDLTHGFPSKALVALSMNSSRLYIKNPQLTPVIPLDAPEFYREQVKDTVFTYTVSQAANTLLTLSPHKLAQATHSHTSTHTTTVLGRTTTTTSTTTEIRARAMSRPRRLDRARDYVASAFIKTRNQEREPSMCEDEDIYVSEPIYASGIERKNTTGPTGPGLVGSKPAAGPNNTVRRLSALSINVDPHLKPPCHKTVFLSPGGVMTTPNPNKIISPFHIKPIHHDGVRSQPVSPTIKPKDVPLDDVTANASYISLNSTLNNHNSSVSTTRAHKDHLEVFTKLYVPGSVCEHIMNTLDQSLLDSIGKELSVAKSMYAYNQPETVSEGVSQMNFVDMHKSLPFEPYMHRSDDTVKKFFKDKYSFDKRSFGLSMVLCWLHHLRSGTLYNKVLEREEKFRQSQNPEENEEPEYLSPNKASKDKKKTKETVSLSKLVDAEVLAGRGLCNYITKHLPLDLIASSLVYQDAAESVLSVLGSLLTTPLDSTSILNKLAHPSIRFQFALDSIIDNSFADTQFPSNSHYAHHAGIWVCIFTVLSTVPYRLRNYAMMEVATLFENSTSVADLAALTSNAVNRQKTVRALDSQMDRTKKKMTSIGSEAVNLLSLLYFDEAAVAKHKRDEEALTHFESLNAASYLYLSLKTMYAKSASKSSNNMNSFYSHYEEEDESTDNTYSLTYTGRILFNYLTQKIKTFPKTHVTNLLSHDFISNLLTDVSNQIVDLRNNPNKHSAQPSQLQMNVDMVPPLIQNLAVILHVISHPHHHSNVVQDFHTYGYKFNINPSALKQSCFSPLLDSTWQKWIFSCVSDLPPHIFIRQHEDIIVKPVVCAALLTQVHHIFAYTQQYLLQWRHTDDLKRLHGASIPYPKHRTNSLLKRSRVYSFKRSLKIKFDITFASNIGSALQYDSFMAHTYPDKNPSSLNSVPRPPLDMVRLFHEFCATHTQPLHSQTYVSFHTTEHIEEDDKKPLYQNVREIMSYPPKPNNPAILPITLSPTVRGVMMSACRYDYTNVRLLLKVSSKKDSVSTILNHMYNSALYLIAVCKCMVISPGMGIEMLLHSLKAAESTFAPHSLASSQSVAPFSNLSQISSAQNSPFLSSPLSAAAFNTINTPYLYDHQFDPSQTYNSYNRSRQNSFNSVVRMNSVSRRHGNSINAYPVQEQWKSGDNVDEFAVLMDQDLTDLPFLSCVGEFSESSLLTQWVMNASVYSRRVAHPYSSPTPADEDLPLDARPDFIPGKSIDVFDISNFSESSEKVEITITPDNSVSNTLLNAESNPLPRVRAKSKFGYECTIPTIFEDDDAEPVHGETAPTSPPSSLPAAPSVGRILSLKDLAPLLSDEALEGRTSYQNEKTPTMTTDRFFEDSVIKPPMHSPLDQHEEAAKMNANTRVWEKSCSETPLSLRSIATFLSPSHISQNYLAGGLSPHDLVLLEATTHICREFLYALSQNTEHHRSSTEWSTLRAYKHLVSLDYTFLCDFTIFTAIISRVIYPHSSPRSHLAWLYTTDLMVHDIVHKQAVAFMLYDMCVCDRTKRRRVFKRWITDMRSLQHKANVSEKEHSSLLDIKLKTQSNLVTKQKRILMFGQHQSGKHTFVKQVYRLYNSEKFNDDHYALGAHIMFVRSVMVIQALIGHSDQRALAVHPFSSLSNTSGASSIDIRRNARSYKLEQGQVMSLTEAIDYIVHFNLWQYCNYRRMAIDSPNSSMTLLSWLRHTEMVTVYACHRIWNDRNGAAKCIYENRTRLSPIKIEGIVENSSIPVLLGDSDFYILCKLTSMISAAIYLATDTDLAALQGFRIPRMLSMIDDIGSAHHTSDDFVDLAQIASGECSNQGIIEVPSVNITNILNINDNVYPDHFRNAPSLNVDDHQNTIINSIANDENRFLSFVICAHSLLTHFKSPKLIMGRGLNNRRYSTSSSTTSFITSQASVCDSVMHIINIADYDVFTPNQHNDPVSKLLVSFQNLGDILESPVLSKKPIIVVCNKTDVFLTKLRNSPLSASFTKYNEKMQHSANNLINSNHVKSREVVLSDSSWCAPSSVTQALTGTREHALKFIRKEIISVLKKHQVNNQIYPLDVGIYSNSIYSQHYEMTGISLPKATDGFHMELPVHHAFLVKTISKQGSNITNTFSDRPVIVLFTSLSSITAVEQLCATVFASTFSTEDLLDAKIENQNNSKERQSRARHTTHKTQGTFASRYALPDKPAFMD